MSLISSAVSFAVAHPKTMIAATVGLGAAATAGEALQHPSGKDPLWEDLAIGLVAAAPVFAATHGKSLAQSMPLLATAAGVGLVVDAGVNIALTSDHKAHLLG